VAVGAVTVAVAAVTVAVAAVDREEAVAGTAGNSFLSD
jgi:hypothetical protein